MQIWRSVRVALALTMLLIPQASAQHPADTARYVMLFSGRPAGFYNEWWSGEELHSVFEYNDRGRGPHEEAVMRVGSDEIPSSLTVIGHGYFKDTVDERFTNAGGTAAWKNQTEHGTRANAGKTLYISAAESPIGRSSSFARRSRMAATSRCFRAVKRRWRRAEISRFPPTGRSVHSSLRCREGSDSRRSPCGPTIVASDSPSCRDGRVSCPAGWEGAVPAMVAAQEKAGTDAT